MVASTTSLALYSAYSWLESKTNNHRLIVRSLIDYLEPSEYSEILHGGSIVAVALLLDAVVSCHFSFHAPLDLFSYRCCYVLVKASGLQIGSFVGDMLEA